MVNDGRWAAVEVVDESVGSVDSQVMVNRGQEVAGVADSFDNVEVTGKTMILEFNIHMI